MSRRTRVRLGYALAATIAAVVLAAVLAAVLSRPQQLLPVGAEAPGFTLPAPGGDVSLSSLRGKVVLLEFCATWSSPCARQAPVLNRLDPAAAEVLSVNGDSEDAASVASFARNHRLRYPILRDPGRKTVSFPARGSRGPVTGRYRVRRFPTFYVVDPAGRIAWRASGVVGLAVLSREIRRAARPVP